MPRAFHLHTVLFLLAAFTFLFFTALSLPFVPSLDLVRVHWEGVPSTGYGGQASLTELRVSGFAFVIAVFLFAEWDLAVLPLITSTCN